jgi:hypothetical protein
MESSARAVQEGPRLNIECRDFRLVSHADHQPEVVRSLVAIFSSADSKLGLRMLRNYAATVSPLAGKINVRHRSAAGDAVFPRRLGARQSSPPMPAPAPRRVCEVMVRAYGFTDPVNSYSGGSADAAVAINTLSDSSFFATGAAPTIAPPVDRVRPTRTGPSSAEPGQGTALRAGCTARWRHRGSR